MTDDNDSLVRGVSVVEKVEVPPDTLHVDGENPNEQSDETFGLLVDSIRDGAWLGGPIIVNRGALPGYDGDGDGLICDGEHRWRAAQEADRETVPVKFCEFRHDAVRRYYRLHLNKVSGEHDTKRDALEYDHLLKEGHSDEVEALTDAADEDLDDLLAELRVDTGVGPEYEYDPDHNVYFEDCVEGMRERLDDDSVDCVITDPPYGIDFESGWGSGFDTITSDEGFDEAAELFGKMLREVSRVLKPDGHFYSFTRWDIYPQFYRILSRHLDPRNVLVWHKPKGGMGDLSGNYVPNHEWIMFASSDTPRDMQSGRPKNVIEYNPPPPAEYRHPTEKPIDLIADLIQNSTRRGDTVLDPFMGSGTTAVAAIQNDRDYAGFEIDEDNYRDVIERRIGEAKRQRDASVNGETE